jgi:hypothetical protein
VPADLGQGRRDLGQPETVTAEALGHTERSDTTGDERVPPVVPAECGRHDVGDGPLPLVWAEVHPNPP